MAKLSSNKAEFRELKFPGSWQDDGPPYSGIGIDDLKIMSPFLRKNWNDNIEPLPISIADRKHLQYGTRSHASDSRKMFGPVMLTANLADGTTVNVRHVVIEGSSQWVIGRIVTSKCDIIHKNGNYLQLPNSVQIPVENVELHSYLSCWLFLSDHRTDGIRFQAKFYCATEVVGDPENIRSRKELTKIVDKVHKRVCGHASLSDMKILLERNDLWTPEVAKCLNSLIDSCEKCARTCEPKQVRKVSLSSYNRSFNDLV